MARGVRAAMLHRFDEYRDHQQQTDRPARAGEEAGDSGHPPARTPRREQHDGCEQHETSPRHIHDEHERRREQVHEPHRGARTHRRGVRTTPAGRARSRARTPGVRDDDVARPVSMPGTSERASEQWEERKKRESVGADAS
jgi:hypothetical protein